MKKSHTALFLSLVTLVSLSSEQSVLSQATKAGLRPAPSLIKEAPAAPKTAEEAYALGQKAFYDGDMAKAKTYLQESLRINPNSVPTQALLEQINRAKMGDPGRVLRGKLEKIILPNFSVQDVSLSDALTAFDQAVQKAGGQPVNVIVKSKDELTAKITLNVKGIPASEALRYIADLGGCTMKYEPVAVVLAPTSSVKAEVPAKP